MDAVCSRCKGTGIESAEAAGGEEFRQFCPDCLAGNTLALKAQGSDLDPAKYPPCQFEGSKACNSFGDLPDGTSCDCDKTSILGFESMGCSHETAIKVMCALCSCDEGCSDPVRTLVNRIDEIQNATPHSESAIGAGLNQLVQDNSEGFQVALDHNWLSRFL